MTTAVHQPVSHLAQYGHSGYQPLHFPAERDDSAQLRFPVGTRVECLTSWPNGWSTGVVVAHNYRAEQWKTKVVPYQVKLTDEQLIYAPFDDDVCIRAAPAGPVA